jgi:hypothetical protein
MKTKSAWIALLLAGLVLSRDGLSNAVTVDSGVLQTVSNVTTVGKIGTDVNVKIVGPLDLDGKSVAVKDQMIIDALTKNPGGATSGATSDFSELTKMPTTWQQVVQMQGLAQSTAGAGADYQSQRSYYDTQVLKTLSNKLSLQQSRVIGAYERSAKTSAAGLAMAEVSYNGIEARLRKIQQAQSQIATTANVKQAIDLTNQLVVHVASLQAEILRVQTVQTALLATTADRDNQVLASRREFFGAGSLSSF